MSPEPIRPALTPEEWQDLDSGEALIEDGELCVRYDSGLASEVVGDRHALAALCLHGQPFGFTWDDVEVLREISPEHRIGCAHLAFVGSDCDCEAEQESATIASVADRIAALLPPREP